eukprot:tig00000498_g1669.t2
MTTAHGDARDVLESLRAPTLWSGVCRVGEGGSSSRGEHDENQPAGGASGSGNSGSGASSSGRPEAAGPSGLSRPSDTKDGLNNAAPGTSKDGAAQQTFRDAKTGILRKLSVNLIDTYQLINQVYYANKKKRQLAQAENKQQVKQQSNKKHKNEVLENHNCTDEEGFYVEQIGETIADRYAIESLLGQGSFGKVFKAQDSVGNEHVALKIIRASRHFYVAAQQEIKILKLINEHDKHDQYHCVRMREHFMWRGHQCIVFELLSYSLYDLLRHTKFKGVSLNLVRTFTRQILINMAYLGLKEITIMHCDLKPENVLLMHPRKSAVKVVDFGSACPENEQVYKYIQSRFYRAPEVILGYPAYTRAIDMWSLGCIMVEMHTGEPIFDGQDEFEQVHKISEVLGKPPRHMITATSKAKEFFYTDDHGLTWNLKPEKKHSRTPGGRPLGTVIGTMTNGPRGSRKGQPGHTFFDYLTFEDLVKRMLVYDPTKRITPHQALQHPFITGQQAPALGSPASTPNPGGVPEKDTKSPIPQDRACCNHHKGGILPGDGSKTCCVLPTGTVDVDTNSAPTTELSQLSLQGYAGAAFDDDETNAPPVLGAGVSGPSQLVRTAAA